MKKLKRTYTRCALTAALVLLVMLIAGSIWDLPISKFLYPGRESSFGQFFAAFGELPAFLAMTSAGILLLFNRKRLRKSWNVLFLAASAVLVAGGIQPLMPWLLSFAAGAMMYVVVEELIPEAHLGEHSNVGTLGVMGGFVVMMILDVALG